MPDPSSNGRNGLFLKVLVGITATLAVAGIGATVKLYRDVGVLQADISIVRRVDRLEDLATNIASDRDKRTIILQGFREDIVDLKRRVEQVERGREWR